MISDTVTRMYRGDPTLDFGAREPLFVEGAHYVALLGFDPAPAAGKRVRSARLWLHRAGEEPLRTLVLSTISVPWFEGGGDGYGTDSRGSCAAYVRLDGEGRPVRWAGPGSEITDVIMTEGHTLRAEGAVRRERGGWQSVEVPAPLVESILCGDSYGLALVDGKGQLRTADDNFIEKKFHSRASRFAPYLRVELEQAEGPPPAAPQVTVLPAPEAAGLEGGAVRLAILPAGEGDSRGCSYEVRTAPVALDAATVDSARTVPRWQLPHPHPAGTDTVLLRGLPAGASLGVAVRVVSRDGRRGPWAFAAGEAVAARAIPELASTGGPDLGGKIRVWACGAGEKVNPVSGRLLEEAPALYARPAERADFDYMYRNWLWEAREGRIELDVPRGGTAAFQVVIEAPPEGLSGLDCRADWLDRPAGAGRFPVRVFKLWYLASVATGAWYPEVAVPLSGEVAIPDSANRIEGQRNQALLVEFQVPREAGPGSYRGAVTIGARGLLSRRIEVRVEVHPAVLPEVLPFVTELNVYTPVGGQYGLDNNSDEYFALEEQYYRMAHEHLCALNQIPYTQTGEIKFTGAPELAGEGGAMHVADWSAWDRRFGRYLDGSAFRDTDRPSPVPVMYLPFHENWPGDLRRLYRFTPTDTSYIGQLNQHTLEAPPIEEAFDPAYQQAFLNVMGDFIAHFRERGWTGTEFQFYLNNKYYWKGPEMGGDRNGVAWWLLDEPYHWDDFKALAWFGELFMRATDEADDLRLVYRLDVSRPHLSFGLFDGMRSVSYVSAMFYERNHYLRGRQERFGEDIRNYGAFNNLEESNLATAGWPLQAWLGGGSGVLPWQVIGDDSNFERFQNTAVLYPGLRFGIRGPVASLRLKAARQGTEDAVLLELLARREGWSREQAAAAVYAKVGRVAGGTVEEYFDDAGRVGSGQMSSAELAALRRAVLRSLDRE